MSAPPLLTRRPGRPRRNFFESVTSRHGLASTYCIGPCTVKLTAEGLNRATAEERSTILDVSHQLGGLVASHEATPAPAEATAEQSAPEPAAPHLRDVREFIQGLEFTDDAFVTKSELLAAYRAWCRGLGDTPVRAGEQALFVAVIEAGGRYSRSRRIAGKQARTVEGLRLKPSGRAELSSSPVKLPQTCSPAESTDTRQLQLVPAEGFAHA